MTDPDNKMLTELAVEIIAAYVANNSLPAAELPALLQNVHGALGRISGQPSIEEPPPEELKPAVAVKKSVADDYIVCLEDGKRFKSLKRHLHSEHGLSPQSYRAKWDLPKDYPMVAPAYAKSRSALAKTLGLGRKAAPTNDQVSDAAADTTVTDEKPARRPRKPSTPKAA